MKGYPSWFSPYSRPFPPQKPSKEHFRTEEVYSGDYLNKATVLKLVNDWSGEQYNWEFNSYNDYGDSCINVVVTEQIPFDNERYEEQMAEYKVAYAAYREKLAEWKPLKAKHDAAEKAKRDERDRKQLDRLKKRLGEA